MAISEKYIFQWQANQKAQGFLLAKFQMPAADRGDKSFSERVCINFI